MTPKFSHQNDPRFYNASADRCYRVLELPFNVKHPDKNSFEQKPFTIQEIKLQEETLDPVFLGWLNKLGLQIKFARLFLAPATWQYTRHVDIRQPNDQSVALNFAFDDQDTTVSWYNLKPDEAVKIKINGIGEQVYYFDEASCTSVLSTEIKHLPGQPFLINTGYIHTVKVGSKARYCFSYFFKKPGNPRHLQWDESLDIFSPFIKN